MLPEPETPGATFSAATDWYAAVGVFHPLRHPAAPDHERAHPLEWGDAVRIDHP